jgi:hypothetical protein
MGRRDFITLLGGSRRVRSRASVIWRRDSLR